MTNSPDRSIEQAMTVVTELIRVALIHERRLQQQSSQIGELKLTVEIQAKESERLADAIRTQAEQTGDLQEIARLLLGNVADLRERVERLESNGDSAS
ncbi:hypothetical protein [Leptolyngbya sp. FACHB-261]|uniref:hypothetical protein n=1 Tax=Leptolyngbya sp. FACHB-261 TaxID=2692806 RepID=UPI001684A9CA|nr:hypothetical protein [Leptolyngbya sp. FACHB-261]MBD2103920.1 hypothetical protein [Leptolyngbya sp. FACHB-261]